MPFDPDCFRASEPEADGMMQEALQILEAHGILLARDPGLGRQLGRLRGKIAAGKRPDRTEASWV